MKLAKATNDEIENLLSILSEVERLSKEIRTSYVTDIDLSDYDIMCKFNNSGSEEFLTDLVEYISSIHFQRILFNLTTLLENCADPNLSYLDFNAEIKSGLDLLQKQKQEA